MLQHIDSRVLLVVAFVLWFWGTQADSDNPRILFVRKLLLYGLAALLVVIWVFVGGGI